MHYTSQTNINNRQMAKRLAVFVFLLCFIMVSIFSQTFIMAHADHKHDQNGAHGSCAACAEMQNTENMLKQLGVITGGALSVFAAIFAVAIIFKSAHTPIGFQTLANLKIRMNN